MKVLNYERYVTNLDKIPDSSGSYRSLEDSWKKYDKFRVSPFSFSFDGTRGIIFELLHIVKR